MIFRIPSRRRSSGVLAVLLPQPATSASPLSTMGGASCCECRCVPKDAASRAHTNGRSVPRTGRRALTEGQSAAVASSRADIVPALRLADQGQRDEQWNPDRRQRSSMDSAPASFMVFLLIKIQVCRSNGCSLHAGGWLARRGQPCRLCKALPSSWCFARLCLRSKKHAVLLRWIPASMRDLD